MAFSNRSLVPRDNIPILVQDPFTGFVPGQGEREINQANVGQLFYWRDNEDIRRILKYLRNEALTDVDSHYKAFCSLGNGGEVTPPPEAFWLPVDFFGMLSRLMRHYVFGPMWRVSGPRDADNFEEIQRIAKTNRLIMLLNQQAEALTTLGDTVFRIEVEDVENEDAPELGPFPQAQIRAINPTHYFPELDRLDMTRIVRVKLAWVFPVDEEFQGKQGLASSHVVLFEIHEPGVVDYELWEWDGKEVQKELPVSSLFPELEGGPTGIDEIPIVHVGNDVPAGAFWGRSEFHRIERIVLAIENRLSQEDEVLDKHARPKLIVGPGVLDPRARTSLADFDVIEIEPSILEKAVKPEYLTWDMQIGAIQHEIDKLEEYFYVSTETSPAAFGVERDGSQVESGRALRFKSHRTVNKVNDQRVTFDAAVRTIFRIAQKLEIAAREEDGMDTYQRGPIQIFWPDPIIEDQDAEVQQYVSRKAVGLVSTERAVMDLDNLTPDEAEREVQTILQDQVNEAAAESVRAEPAADSLGAGTAEPVPGVDEVLEPDDEELVEETDETPAAVV